MTWVRNLYQHAFQPTYGPSFGSREDADIDVSPPLEQDAITHGGLLVLDDDYVPPPEVVTLHGSWKAPVENFESLPTGGNQRGDARLVVYDAAVSGPLIRWWDGGAWQPVAGGAGGVDPIPDYIDVPALLTGIHNGQVLAWDDADERFEPAEVG